MIKLLLFFLILSCGAPDEISTSLGFSIKPGDIIASDNGSDKVYHYDSEGKFQRILYSVNSSSEIIYGLAWDPDNLQILVSVDGADRVTAISAIDGSINDVFISNTNLNGALRSLTRLPNGDVIVLESNNLERFSSAGLRQVSGGFPKSNVCTNPSDIDALVSGGFVVSCYGSDRLTIHDDLGATLFTQVSGIGGTTNAYGVIELENGNIAAIWDGSSDTMAIYSNDFSSTLATYSNTSLMPTPRAIAQHINGNILVGDASTDQLIEIDQDGNFVRVLPLINGVSWDLLVIPEF